jgi:hypothetical protein
MHSKWVDADGNSEICDWYEERVAKLVALLYQLSYATKRRLLNYWLSRFGIGFS